MKSVENIVDLSAGLLILVLTVSTAFFGLKLYHSRDLQNNLADKNTLAVETHILASDSITTADNIEELATILIAAVENTDNIRQTTVIIKSRTDSNDIVVEHETITVNSLGRTEYELQSAIDDYLQNSPNAYLYGPDIISNANCFVIAHQSKLFCYILLP